MLEEMKKIDSNSRQQKILELLYSGNAANDLLAFEFIQHVEYDKDFFFLPFLAAILNPTGKEDVEKYLDYVTPKLSEDQLTFVNAVIQEGYCDWEGWQYYQKLFSNEQLLKLIYITIRRTGNGHYPFLILDNREHPDRRLVFESLKKTFKNTKFLSFAGLYPDEIDELVQFHLDYNPKREFNHLRIQNMKESYFPKSLLGINVERITYHIPIVDDFPNELLSMKGVKELGIIVGPNSKLPTDWSGLAELESLSFGGADYVFENIDFVKQCRNLKVVFIAGAHYLSSPDLLVGNRANFQTGAQFKSNDGYYLNGVDYKKRFNVYFASGVLGKSDFSLEKQKYYLKKLSNYDLPAFKLEELKELSTLDFGFLNNKIEAHLSMKKFYPEK